jgi:hypothetical protein
MRPRKQHADLAQLHAFTGVLGFGFQAFQIHQAFTGAI